MRECGMGDRFSPAVCNWVSMALGIIAATMQSPSPHLPPCASPHASLHLSLHLTFPAPCIVVLGIGPPLKCCSLIALVVFLLMQRLRRRNPRSIGKTLLRQVITLAQTIVTISRMEYAIPTSVYNIGSMFSAVDGLALNAHSVSCATSWSFYDKVLVCGGAAANHAPRK